MPQQLKSAMTVTTRFAAALFCVALSAVLPAQPARQTDANPPGNAQNGKQLFTAKGCDDCHGADAQGAPKKNTGGPSIGPPAVAFPAFLRQIRHPSGMMDPYTTDDASDAELADIYAYLVSLGKPKRQTTPALPPGGHPDIGKRQYVSYGCNLCHGEDGAGSAKPAGPRIGPTSLALGAFVGYVRQPKSPPQGTMPAYDGRVISNNDLLDIYSYLQTIPASPPEK